MAEFIVAAQEEGMRLDAACAVYAEELSRSYIRKISDEGKLLLNGKTVKPSVKVSAGDHIALEIPPPVPLVVRPEKMDLTIVYEDEDLLVVNKPKGLSVHPGAGHPDGTLVNGLLEHCGDALSGINGVLRPGIVHRIDKDTSGLLVVCKNDAAHRGIASQLEVHSIKRLYYGITIGTPNPEEGTVDRTIGRSRTDRKKMAVDVPGGKHAVTHYKVEERFRGYALCSFRLETGRTHQIRVHMASLGHPLLGDTVYGGKQPSFAPEGQSLHAAVLGFLHPRTGVYLEFCAPLPIYFQELLNLLRNLK